MAEYVPERIDRDQDDKLYEQLKAILIQQIEDGVLQPGAALPPDHELSDRYGVSRVTVNRALGELARLRIIERAQGRRSVVIAPKITLSLNELISLTETLRRQGLSTHARVLSRDRVGVEALPDRSAVSAGWFVRVRRLRFVGEQPAVVATSYIPADLASQIDLSSLENDSFYATCERVLNRSVARREQTLATVVATSDTVSLLGVSRHSAHYNVRTRTYADDDTLLELAESVFHGRLFEFSGCLRRGPRDQAAAP